jgi:hypothetical protein
MDKPADPLLRVCAPIDAAEWERMHAEVRAISAARLAMMNARFVSRVMRYMPKRRPNSQKIVYALGTFGLIVSLLMTLIGGIPYKGYRLELLFAAFFVAIMVVTYFVPAIEALQKRRQPAFNFRLAGFTANRVLKSAKNSLPFDAEYQFFDDKVAYTRIANDKPELRWKRALKGVYLPGDGFTLLYKKQTSQEPYGILLHTSPEVSEQLERLGVKRMVD